MTDVFTGRHVLGEFDGIDADLLNDIEALTTMLTEAVTAAGATVCGISHKKFDPQGVTVLALLSESHASIHTYPERSAMFVDIFTCGESADPELAAELLRKSVGATNSRISVVGRGLSAAQDAQESVGTGLTRTWQIDDVVLNTDTQFQNVLIGRSAQGLSLFSGGERQSTEFSQLTYHEALMVPAFLLARELDRVLIIGSSEGVASELSVAAGASHVDHVDIDEEVVKLCATLLPYGYTSESLANAELGVGPMRVHYADGYQFAVDAAARGEQWDVVIVDLPDEIADDPDAQINRLYGEEFLSVLKSLLSPGGVVGGQAGCPTMWRNETLISMWKRFNTVFDSVVYYGSDEHEWAFLFGCADAVSDPVTAMQDRLATLPYTPESIDALALVGNTVPPLRVRRAR